MNAPAFKTLPYITYGTTRLGDGAVPSTQRVQWALDMMQTGLWFHTSHQYGDTLNILGQAFKQDPKHIPKLMIKILGSDIAEEIANGGPWKCCRSSRPQE